MALSQNRHMATALSWIAAAFLAACPVRASEFDAVDIAFEALQAAGAAASVNITEDEKRFLKPLVRCLADNPNSPVVECGTRIVTDQLPEEAQTFAKCVVEGRGTDTCMREAAVAQLPDDAQHMADCLLRGDNAASCATEDALRRLPEPEQSAVRCMTKTPDPFACGLSYAQSEGEEQLRKAWDKVRSGASTLGREVQGPIRNIVDVALGIRDDDWEKVVTAGGKVAAKIAGRIALKILLPGVGDIVFGPAIDAAVDNRIGMVADIIRAAKTRDPGAVSEVLIAANFGYPVYVTCAVLRGDVPITGDIKNAVCAVLGDAVTAFADAGGSIVNKIADIIRFDEILKEVELVSEEARLGFSFLTGQKSGKCRPVKDFYADRFARCYSKQAYLSLTGPQSSQAFLEYLNSECRKEYIECGFSDFVTKICEPLVEKFKLDTAVLTSTIQTEAARVSATKIPLVFRRSGITGIRCGIEDAEREQAAISCKSHLDHLLPPTGFIDTQDCKPIPNNDYPGFGGPAFGLYEDVCNSAVEGRKRGVRDVCISELRTDTSTNSPISRRLAAENAMKIEARRTGNSRGEPGLGPRDAFRNPGSCTGGMELDASGKCACPPGSTWSGGRCAGFRKLLDEFAGGRAASSNNSTTQLEAALGAGRAGNSKTSQLEAEFDRTKDRDSGCRPPRPNGTPPNCCPSRTYYSNGKCRYRVRDIVTSGVRPTVGRASPAGCPSGTVYFAGFCRRTAARAPVPGVKSNSSVVIEQNCPPGTYRDGRVCRRPAQAAKPASTRSTKYKLPDTPAVPDKRVNYGACSNCDKKPDNGPR